MNRFSSLFLVLALLISSNLAAQTANDTESKSAVKYRHHLGFNTTGGIDYFLRGAYFIPMDMMYRFQVNDFSALRFGMGFSRSTEFSLRKLPQGEHYHFFLAPSIGVERLVKSTNRLSCLFGADLRLKIVEVNNTSTRTPRKVQNGTYMPERVQTRIYNESNLEFAFSPFAGFRYDLSNRFYLYTQIGFSVGGRIFILEDASFETGDFGEPVLYQSAKNESGHQNFWENTFFSGIQLNYRF